MDGARRDFSGCGGLATIRARLSRHHESTSRRVFGCAALALVLVVAFAGRGRAQGAENGGSWHFVDRTVEARLTVDGEPVEHGFVEDPRSSQYRATGGAAAGDYDGDGWLDLYVVRGDIGPNLLFRNRGDGTFEERGARAGVDQLGGVGCGPLFADLDGDGWLDLIVGGFGARSVNVFRNRGDGTFDDITESTGIQHEHATFSIACGDYDLDGDLDMYTSHWGCPAAAVGHLWRNDGNASFTDVDVEANAVRFSNRRDFTFTPNFADVTNDGQPDLLVAADFETSQIFHNVGQGRFVEVALGVANPDENGMGAAVGDLDNDGDLDWFVTSIWDFDQDPEFNWGVSGNRMYLNRGDGTFVDATDHAGVREGDWGWAASFADFNNDGWLDIAMVNGWNDFQFVDDPARFFVNRGDGTFDERGAELGVADTGQGRGVVCFDYDGDGDLDLLIANNSGPLRLLRNETPGTANFLSVCLRGDGPNTHAVGARVYVRTSALTQMRELQAGSNYVSSNPIEAHFGLGSAPSVLELRIVWPDGRVETHAGVPTNRRLTFYESTTAVELSEFAAEPADAGVLLSWRWSEDAVAMLGTVHLQRAECAAGPFQNVAAFSDVRTPVMSYLDAELPESRRLWYRLLLELADGTTRSSATVLVDRGETPHVGAELLWARAVADRAHIRFRVSGAPTDVTLEIYDVRGRLIWKALRERRAPGIWTLEWPARTQRGQPVARGIYVVRLRTAAGSRQVKLALMPR